ncbi:MAG: AbrB/MazE/SpoVT family DNA-binding domain-containing protein [Opitutales bacterium]
MESTVELDPSNRVVLTKALRQTAGISPHQKLRVTSTPERIILEAGPDHSSEVAKRGKLKVWTGDVPRTSIFEAVEQARH